MKSRNQLLYTIVGFFVIFGLVISMNNSNLVFAENENTFKLYELKVGTFIPNDSIIVGSGFYDISGMTNHAKIYFSADENSNGDTFCDNEKSFILESYDSMNVEDYSKMFLDDSKEYEGWVVYHVFDRSSNRYGYDNYGISLKPSKKTENLNQYENLTESDICTNGTPTNMLWYKKKDTISDVSLNAPDESIWNINENSYEFAIQNLESDKSLKSELTIDFEAKNGDLLVFEAMSSNHLNASYTLSGVSSYFNIGGNSFKNISLDITTDGQQQFKAILLDESSNASGKYEYGDSYFRLKNPEVYTFVNKGNELDTGLVEKGSKIFYKCDCKNINNYSYSNSGFVQYGNADDNKEIIDEGNNVTTDKNPGTYSNVIIISIIVFGVLFITFANRKVLFRKDS